MFPANNPEILDPTEYIIIHNHLFRDFFLKTNTCMRLSDILKPDR